MKKSLLDKFRSNAGHLTEDLELWPKLDVMFENHVCQ